MEEALRKLVAMRGEADGPYLLLIINLEILHGAFTIILWLLGPAATLKYSSIQCNMHSSYLLTSNF